MGRRFLGGIFILTGLCKISLKIYGPKVLLLMDKASQPGFGTVHGIIFPSLQY